MTKTYNIVTLPTGATPDGTQTFTVKVEILDEAGNVVLNGETSVVTDSADAAYAYGESVFLPDLKANLPNKLGDMALPTDPIPAETSTEPEPEPGV